LPTPGFAPEVVEVLDVVAGVELVAGLELVVGVAAAFVVGLP
jgi:hypothetical protein